MEAQQMWEGVLHAKLSAATADQAWSHLKHFCGIHRLLPGVETCTLLDGAEDLPGCMRYVAGVPLSKDGGEPFIPWAKERLLSFDPAGRSQSYEVVESNMGFRRYEATLKANPGEGGEGGGGGGCTLEWLFTADPVEGWTRDGLASYLQKGLEDMAKRIEEAVSSG